MDMDKYKVVIVDDDQAAVDQLAHLLAQDERFMLMDVAQNSRMAHKVVLKEQPDLLFLDVELPDISGMELLQAIRSSITWNMRVVFYTAYDKYMVQAIRESAFDYLLKPFTEMQLREILERFIKHHATNPRTVQALSALPGKTFIIFTPTNEMLALRPAEIGFFRYCSERKLWEVIPTNQPPLALRRGITAEQITAFSSGFIQIHQSYIINIDYLMLIKDSKCVLYPPFDKVSELQVSKKFKKELQERFCW